MTILNPYIAFTGECEEALNFYADCFNGKVTNVSRYEGSGMECADDFKQKLMHGRVEFGNNVIMGSDHSPKEQGERGKDISLSIGMDDSDAMEVIYNKVANGGTVTFLLQQTFWAVKFGMLKDKYGINWMFNCEAKK